MSEEDKFPYILYVIEDEIDKITEVIISDEEDEDHFIEYINDEGLTYVSQKVFNIIKNHKIIHTDFTYSECMACGTKIANRDEWMNHDNVECFAQSEMTRKYSNLIG